MKWLAKVEAETVRKSIPIQRQRNSLCRKKLQLTRMGSISSSGVNVWARAVCLVGQLADTTAHSCVKKAWRATVTRSSISLVVGSEDNEIEHLFRNKIVGSMFVATHPQTCTLTLWVKANVATACRLQNRAKPGRMLWENAYRKPCCT